jgi:hypothetical protein
MKSISFNAAKDGNGYVKSVIVPANRADARRADKLGVTIAMTLLVLTAAVITMVLLAL